MVLNCAELPASLCSPQYSNQPFMPSPKLHHCQATVCAKPSPCSILLPSSSSAPLAAPDTYPPHSLPGAGIANEGHTKLLFISGLPSLLCCEQCFGCTLPLFSPILQHYIRQRGGWHCQGGPYQMGDECQSHASFLLLDLEEDWDRAAPPASHSSPDCG